MDSEAVAKILNQCKKHLDEIMIAVFVLLAVVVGYYWWVEQQPGYIVPLNTNPQAWVPPQLIEGDPLKQDFLTTFTTPAKPFEEAPESIIVIQNLWEIRSAQGQQQLEQEAIRIHNEAKQAFDAGNLDRAEELANRARRNKPDFKANNDLLASIGQKRQELIDAQAAANAPLGGF